MKAEFYDDNSLTRFMELKAAFERLSLIGKRIVFCGWPIDLLILGRYVRLMLLQLGLL